LSLGVRYFNFVEKESIFHELICYGSVFALISGLDDENMQWIKTLQRRYHKIIMETDGIGKVRGDALISVREESVYKTLRFKKTVHSLSDK
jgi:hypothetical protein